MTGRGGTRGPGAGPKPATQKADPEPGVRRLGQYRLLKQLATGGMAEIYLASTRGVEGFEKQVALKVLHSNLSSDPNFIRMLVAEAKLAVQLHHPNIVQTYDLGRVEGAHYIVMELVRGGDLFTLLRTSAERDVYFPFDVAAFIAAEVCEGLDYAHHKTDAQGRPLGVIHRDVSPQNVLVSPEGDVKICDFGIAKVASSDVRTAAGVIKGKYYYMSPEQAWADPVDARSDIFSCGILLYEMLVGQMLYLEESIERLLDQVRRADIAPPSTRRPGVPRELEAIVMRALRKRPADRWQTAAEMGQALTAWLRGAAPEAGPARAGAFAAAILDAPEPDTDAATDPRGARVRDPRQSTAEVSSVAPDQHSLIFLSDMDEKTSAGSPAGIASRFRSLVDEREDEDESEMTTVEGGDPAPSSLYGDEGTLTQERTAIEDLAALRDANRTGESTLERTVDDPPAALPGVRAKPAPAFESDDTHTDERPPALPARPPPIPPARIPTPARGTPPPPPPVPVADLHSEPTRLGQPAGISGETPRLPAPAPSPPIGMPPPSPSDFNPQATRPGTLGDATFSGAPTGPGKDTAPAAITGPLTRIGRRWPWIAGIAGAVTLIIVLLVLLLAPDARRGTLMLASFPVQCRVRLDQREVATATPVRLDDLDTRLPHHLTVSAPGFAPWERDVVFEPGTRRVELHAILEPLRGKLHVESTPPDAEVLVDGHPRGRTPLDLADLSCDDDIDVEVRRAGYKPAKLHLVWDERRALSASVTLEKQRRER